jgi:Domain of unknown function (DUF4389)
VAGPFLRVSVTDDLQRSRLTVFFRLFLAIPHFIWWFLWSIAAVLVAIVNWFATLFAGRPPVALHGFLTRYIRYSVHFYGYLYLAANPYPGFAGDRGYPIDVEFDDPETQRRVVVGFRFFLMIPALAFVAVFDGATHGAWFQQQDQRAFWSGAGTLIVAAFLGWFVCVLRAQMPNGLRDLQVYGLRYLAEAAAYAFVLTERYPNVDPTATPAQGREHVVWLAITDDLRRSRLTVFFRLLLALPHLVWVTLWSIAVFFAAIVMWFATLITGRPPAGLHRFLSAFVRYTMHLYSYVTLAANPFPGFTGTAGSYPIDVELPPPEPQRRLVTGFRLFLALPGFAVSSAVGGLLVLSAIFGWFASLALGRMPRSLREAQTYALRYSVQVSAYFLLLTERYPYSGPIRIPRRT